jgi:hypothetical protein
VKEQLTIPLLCFPKPNCKKHPSRAIVLDYQLRGGCLCTVWHPPDDRSKANLIKKKEGLKLWTPMAGNEVALLLRFSTERQDRTKCFF